MKVMDVKQALEELLKYEDISEQRNDSSDDKGGKLRQYDRVYQVGDLVVYVQAERGEGEALDISQVESVLIQYEYDLSLHPSREWQKAMKAARDIYGLEIRPPSNEVIGGRKTLPLPEDMVLPMPAVPESRVFMKELSGEILTRENLDQAIKNVYHVGKNMENALDYISGVIITQLRSKH